MDPLKSSCRACFQVFSLLKSQNTVKLSNPIRSYYNKPSVTYQDAFFVCTGFQLKDMEPQELCEECASELLISFQFKEKCEATQNKLEKLLEDSELIKLEEVVIKVEPLEEIVAEEIFHEPVEVRDVSDPEVLPEDDDNFESDIRFKCDFCGKSLANKGSLRYHLNHVHKDDPKVPCPHCDTPHFSQLLTSHIRNCKKRDKRKLNRYPKSICPVCGELKSSDHIKNHLENQNEKKQIQNTTQKNYICDICGHSYHRKLGLTAHIKIIHLKIKASCKHCILSFRTHQQLDTHMRKVHPEVKPLFKCPLCDFQTPFHGEIKKHRFKHTGERNYKCNFCRKEFFSKDKLNTHVAIHSDERPFACEMCGATFKTRKYLACHKRVHLERNYECPVCQRGFLTNQLLTQHAKSKHPEYQMPPPGTIMSKSYRKKVAEKMLKMEAMKRGADQKDLDAIVVTEAPPIEELQLFQPN